MRHRFVWFARNDLRLHDNACLAQIAAHKGDKEGAFAVCTRDVTHAPAVPLYSSVCAARHCRSPPGVHL